MSKRHWLEITEYVGIVASLSGTVAAVATQQAIYAAAPLTVTLGLNTLNRQRLAAQVARLLPLETQLVELTQQQGQLVESTAQIEPRITGQLEELQQLLLAIQAKFEPITTQYHQLETQYQALETQAQGFSQSSEEKWGVIQQVLDGVVGELPALREQFNSVWDELRPLREQLPSLQEKQRELAMTLTEVSQQTSQRVAAIQGELSPLQGEVKTLAQQQISSQFVRDQLTPIQEKLTQLNDQWEAITHRQGLLNGLQERLEMITGEIGHLHQQLNSLSVSALGTDEAQANAILTQLEALDRQFKEWQGQALPAPSPVDLSPLEREISDLRGALQGVQAQIEPLFNPPVVEELASLREAILFREAEQDAGLQSPPTPPVVEEEAEAAPEAPPMAEEDPPVEPEVESEPTPPELPDLEELGRDLTEGVRGLGDNLAGLGSTLRDAFGRFAASRLNPEKEAALLKVWHCVETLPSELEQVRTVALSGLFIACPDADYGIKLWDRESLNPRRMFMGHRDEVFCLAFSPDGHRLVSGSADNSLKLWDVNTGQLLHTFEGHFHGVSQVLFSPHGQTIASCSYDKTVKLWDVGTGRELRTLKGHWDRVYAIAFSPDGKTLVSGSSDGTLKSWDVQTGEKLRSQAVGGTLHSLVFSPDGQTLASGGSDRKIRLWTVPSQQELNSLRLLNQVYSLAWHPSQPILASATTYKTITFWDTTTGEKVALLAGHENRVNAIAFSPDGQQLVSASQDGTVKLWEKREE
ncbi:WD40 repeat domain-containing protein [Spirulina subsalsa]|uniref:WD40 repeat domain-containing protein n=1 Tax=Spirulina subsalsa TaxID=54311 RepID=UPI0002F16DA9|nr:WD40 repeat domain-containing protein [Spirulina subsalsa]